MSLREASDAHLIHKGSDLTEYCLDSAYCAIAAPASLAMKNSTDI